ncbi:hypothetical protein AB3M83_02885 [Microbacterium sp. 179-B 1A2 NHS]|uniref:hypothetical protein n=1 Tax=Microbacterium sp. 179-B 1A2 NHS TaxID=3142383 RepID=UPI0039A109FD
MKLADALGALRRRWYILLAGLLIAAGASYAVWNVVPPEYERTATRLLLPGAATLPKDANPYLYVGGLFQVADILVRAISADDITALTDGHPGATVSVSRDVAAGAVMIVSVSASTDGAADEVLEQVLALTEQRLTELQDEQRISPAERIEVVPLTDATASVVNQKNRLLYTVGAGLAVVAIGAILAVLTDTLLRSRRRVHAAAGDDADAEADVDADAEADGGVDGTGSPGTPVDRTGSVDARGGTDDVTDDGTGGAAGGPSSPADRGTDADDDIDDDDVGSHEERQPREPRTGRHRRSHHMNASPYRFQPVSAGSVGAITAWDPDSR